MTMMYYSPLLFSCAFVLCSPLLFVHGACIGTCETDVQDNASCLAAFGAAVQGDLKQAARQLKYGRYCGNNNECVAVANETDIADADADSRCVAGTDNCLPDACDPVDQACQVQQECLDQVRQEQAISDEE